MASKPKAPMPAAERAKQFMPFAALKGFEEALERKENAAEPSAAVSRKPEAARRDKFSGRIPERENGSKGFHA